VHQQGKMVLARFVVGEVTSFAMATQPESGETSAGSFNAIDELLPSANIVAWPAYAGCFPASVCHCPDDVDDGDITAVVHVGGCHELVAVNAASGYS
jgi:hypothetical protein